MLETQELCNQFAFTHLEIIFSLLVMIQPLRFGTCGKAGCYICCRAMNVLRLVHSILQLESILPQEAWMSIVTVQVMIWRSELNPTGNTGSGSLASVMKKHLRSLMQQPSNFWDSPQMQCNDQETQPLQLTAGSPHLPKDEASEHSHALQNVAPVQNLDQFDDIGAADLLAHLNEDPEEGRVDSPKKRKVLDDVKAESPIVAIELTLQRLVSQMDVLTRTLSLFGERLSQTEDKVMRMERNYAQNNRKA